jgi:catechol 2,3-dioxygenase
MTSLPDIKISHLGICVEDIEAMRRFYLDILGFTETDRGETLGLDIVFLSRSPNAHHQIVLTTGRPPNLGRNLIAPMFGPVINQISFELNSLAELRQTYNYLLEKGISDILPANHGTAWSLYFDDPEGNKIEIFVDSDWYCLQPVMEPFDFSNSDSEIITATQKMCEAMPGYQPMEKWRAKVAVAMTSQATN